METARRYQVRAYLLHSITSIHFEMLSQPFFSVFLLADKFYGRINDINSFLCIPVRVNIFLLKLQVQEKPTNLAYQVDYIALFDTD